jgi:RNA polymerase sigma-70 factor (ECF subfamily)
MRANPPCRNFGARGTIAGVLQPAEEKCAETAPATLGDVLYTDSSNLPVAEEDWERLVRAVAAGDQLALHALYDRAHRLVFTVAVRITANRETAEELTVDVFYDVWRRAADYDPANGTVLGWIMNQARSRSIDRLRFEHRRKRLDPGVTTAETAAEAADAPDPVELQQRTAMLLHALGALTPGEREAVETAYFSGLTHAEVAVRLHQPLGTVKTRIRSALHKLRQALASEGALQ